MKQLQRKVTRLKIHDFLRDKKLVLFLHCNYKKSGNKNLGIAQNLLSLSSKEEKVMLLVKNKITQALMLQFSNKSSSHEEYKHPVGKKRRLDHFNLRSERIFLCPQLCVRESEGKGESKAPLMPNIASLCLQRETNFFCFHGPNILLGVSNLILLESVLREYKKQDSLSLVGGFYDNQIINHLQIERLSLCSREEGRPLYSNILNCVKKATSQTFLILQSSLCLSCLEQAQRNLIQLFHFKTSQLFLAQLAQRS